MTTPGAPSGLTATAGNAQVSLSWQAPGSDGGAPVTGYRVYQGTSRTPVASVTGTSATVPGLSNGTTYSYTVTAVNQAGEGPASGGPVLDRARVGQRPSGCSLAVRWISGVTGEPACRRLVKALESKTRFRGIVPAIAREVRTGGSDAFDRAPGR